MNATSIRIWRRLIQIPGLALVVAMGITRLTPAADPQIQHVLAAETVRDIDRAEELQGALKDSDDPSVRWQSGMIRGHGVWWNYRDLVEVQRSRPVIREYLERRAQTGSAPADQKRLADWCRSKGLDERDRAHLYAAVAQDRRLMTPAILKRMGFRVNGPLWVSSETEREFRRFESWKKESLKRWLKPLETLKRRLTLSKPIRERALRDLAAIRDPAAVAAIDDVFGATPVDQLAAINTLRGIGSWQSSQVLARLAITNDSTTVRRRATEALQQRRLEDFVPPMIEMIQGPITWRWRDHVETTPVVGIQVPVYFLLRSVFFRESARQVHVLNLNWHLGVRYREVGRYMERRPGMEVRLGPVGDAAVREIRRQFRAVESLAMEANAEASKLNARADEVLSQVSGEDSRRHPEDWWLWWDEYQDRESLSVEVKEVVAARKDFVRFVEVPFVVRMSCFAAGTPVWTDTGLRPIEQLEPGDLVVAKDVETGELALKPVLKRTERPVHSLRRLSVNGETITGTAGHQFWQSGRGWVKFHDLEPGRRLHTVRGNAQTEQVQMGPEEKTYNLVVADFHTYFVGESGLLVQDLLPTRPTNMVVPGLTRYELETMTENPQP